MNKKLALILLAAIISTISAAAQFRIGPRIGVDVNSLKFNTEVANKENLAGFVGGLQAEFMIPALNFGLDASVMYVRRSSTFIENQLSTNKIDVAKDYIEVPINIKYKFGLPIISNAVSPYVFTGPSFSFLTSGTAISEALRSSKTDVAWNVGAGLELFSHLQIGASYGFGMTKALKLVNINSTGQIDAKNSYWTVTAAWLF
jgi:hypothetical protein